MSKYGMGQEGERTACEYLTRKGYRIIARNVRMNGGEIDIIASLNGVTAFIEVKRRISTLYGQPAESVSKAKRKRIISAAYAYMAMNGLMDSPVRFDIIELLPGEINHIESAFDASGYY